MSCLTRHYRRSHLTIMNQTDIQELVDFLWHVLIPPVTTTPALKPTFAPVTSLPGSVFIACPMVNSVPYSGSADDCNTILQQCSLALVRQLHPFPMEKSKNSLCFILVNRLSTPMDRITMDTEWTSHLIPEDLHYSHLCGLQEILQLARNCTT